MLKKEISILSFLGLLLMSSACNNNSVKSSEFVKMKFRMYDKTYSIINDSIQMYEDSELATFRPQYIWNWQVDSMIAINSQNNLLFASLISNAGSGKGMTSDCVQELLGKKINGSWYFFTGGGTLVIPRNMYGKDEMHPLSFHELSQIARKEMLESALFKKDGEYVVSDKWIDDHFYQNGYGKYDTRAQYDSIHWMLIMRKWKEKIDTNEYKPVKKEAKPNS